MFPRSSFFFIQNWQNPGKRTFGNLSIGILALARLLPCLKSHAWIWETTEFCAKKKNKEKNLQTQDENCLIWVFYGVILKRLLSYLKSVPSNFPKFEVCSFTWVFLSSNFKKLLSCLKSTASNLWNCKVSSKTRQKRNQKCLILVF